MLKIAIAQCNYTIGDFAANKKTIIEHIEKARLANADLVLFSELAICGYPPEDLLDYDWFVNECEAQVKEIATHAKGIVALVGTPIFNKGKGRRLQNAMAVLNDGQWQLSFTKTLLPTYDIFSEARYFEPSSELNLMQINGHKIGITICEDLWDIYNDFEYKNSPLQNLKRAGAELILSPSASPFNIGKQALRNTVFDGAIQRSGLPIVYCNQVGAHTDLLFDGDSCAIDKNGKQLFALPMFEPGMEYVVFEDGDLKPAPEYVSTGKEEVLDEEIPLLHKALVFGIREYCGKMGFKKALLGSSGGIDSAVVQALASEALGAENVWPILMPSEFSTGGSVTDAQKLSDNLGNKYSIMPIKPVYDAYMQSLEPEFKDLPFDVAEENLQARARGMMLMALSNKFGHLLLNTSNKSEMAVGYSTLYGDMCGGISVLGDVYKMKVYELARHINLEKEIIPTDIIEKAPSAELRPGQKDSDSLPPYPILDAIIDLYVEKKKGWKEIVAFGYEEALVKRVVKMINRNEYKRFQAPPIIRVTSKAFGRGRLIPLVAKYGVD